MKKKRNRRIVDIGPLLDELKEDLDDLKGATEVLTVEEAVEDEIEELKKLPVIDPEKMIPAWRDPDKDPPKVEEEVLILYRMDSSRCDITTAIYEDGTLCTGESRWAWYDADNFDYDEEKDDYKIPKGWWEDRHFCPDDVYNNVVDFPVVGWMSLPPKEVAQNENT